MTTRPIRLYPDPVLRAVCAPVQAFDARLAALVDEMFEAMYAAPGRGLAAAQLGELARVFVMDETWKDGFYDPKVFVNPQVVSVSVDEAVLEEGCLSIPDRTVFVARPAEVTLRWQDLDGATCKGTFTGFASACVQHEMDHLDGVLCIDHGGAG